MMWNDGLNGEATKALRIVNGYHFKLAYALDRRFPPFPVAIPIEKSFKDEQTNF